jgi:hypothetical protein
VPSLNDRFEAKVDRSGDHHFWLGAKRLDGAGKLTVDGKAITAQRVAWELANGPLSPGAAVNACREVKACVRVEHLSAREVSGVDAAPRLRTPVAARAGYVGAMVGPQPPLFRDNHIEELTIRGIT